MSSGTCSWSTPAVPGRWSSRTWQCETLQGHGIDRRLVRTAVTAVAAAGGTELLVATAAADIGNLRFYQRQGFRMRAIERDVFTPAAGYPPGLSTDGIAVRDRVWLDRSIGHADG